MLNITIQMEIIKLHLKIKIKKKKHEKRRGGDDGLHTYGNRPSASCIPGKKI